MTNASYFVLKENLEPCPTWVTGELCIAGEGLSRGYWRDEAKTTERFIPHPQTGERLYRSGDLGRYLPDGNIEILGRKDFQVKIGGHRIELGEIESVLRQHPQVNAAVAAVSDAGGGQKQLVALRRRAHRRGLRRRRRARRPLHGETRDAPPPSNPRTAGAERVSTPSRSSTFSSSGTRCAQSRNARAWPSTGRNAPPGLRRAVHGAGANGAIWRGPSRGRNSVGFSAV